jgi:formylglycine-generating enzyme required for sulfatase activity
MATIKRGDGSCFWMDTTEVTVTDYAEFLRGAPPPQDSLCAWNVPGGSGGTPGFEPSSTCAAQAGLDGGTGSNQPMTCVDWCDALAFCAYAGKDLCRDDIAFPSDSAKSDFYRACAGPNGSNTYGCAAGCSATVCNGASSGNNAIQPVGAIPACSVLSSDGTTEIFDLSGNVSEWTNSCSPNTETGQCMTRGGAYLSTDSALECATSAPTARKATFPSLGFRCCAEDRADGGP